MELKNIRVLRGPNIWTRFPVLEISLDVRDEEAESGMAALAPLLGPGNIGGAERAQPPGNPSCELAVAWSRAVLALQARAWRSVDYSHVERAPSGEYRCIVEYQDEELAKACCYEAARLCASGGDRGELLGAVARLVPIAAKSCLSDWMASVRDAAVRRDIPWRRLSDGGTLQLGFGSGQRLASPVSGIPNDRRNEALPADHDVVMSLLHSLGYLATTTSDGSPPAELQRFRLLVVAGEVLSSVSVSSRQAVPPAEVHPRVLEACRQATGLLQFPVAVVEIGALHLRAPLEEQNWVDVRVFSGLVDADQFATPATVERFGAALVDSLFPAGATGRIPIATITGVNGKTTTTRLIARFVESTGRRVGMTCSDGVYAEGRCIEMADCSGPKSARRLLRNPRLEAAVLEVARGGILREGLGCDRCDVAVMTNIADGDHLGIAGVDTPEQLARVKRVIVEAVALSGNAVLNATDPLVVAMAPHCPGGIIYFSRDPDHPVVVKHRQAGGRALIERRGTIVVAEGNREVSVMASADIPLTRGGRLAFQVENVLAATAAAWGLGVPFDRVRDCLLTFDSDVKTCPGRFNVLEHGGATIILDFGHNPSAVTAIVHAIEQFPATKRHVVYSADGDRSDLQIRQQTANMGHAFDRVVLYEEPGRFRGRRPGELYQLLREGLSGSTRVQEIEQVDGEIAAIRHALGTIQSGELLLIQVDSVTVDLEFVCQHLGVDGQKRV